MIEMVPTCPLFNSLLPSKSVFQDVVCKSASKSINAEKI
jgi:hypothetical protein